MLKNPVPPGTTGKLGIVFKDPADEGRFFMGPQIVLTYLGRQPGCDYEYCAVNPHEPCWHSKVIPRELKEIGADPGEEA